MLTLDLTEVPKRNHILWWTTLWECGCLQAVKSIRIMVMSPTPYLQKDENCPGSKCADRNISVMDKKVVEMSD